MTFAVVGESWKDADPGFPEVADATCPRGL